eukprot:TRINITY_DN23242_c0_g3_i1.p2 TRINITY_DN23242_c0_g3~~TRINITY_DN23242_c0_g3_i1.p2  ORF type:complete len:113 (-),score=35.27 TRINITY_DN23242_c0_g3_i1:166-504(-)
MMAAREIAQVATLYEAQNPDRFVLLHALGQVSYLVARNDLACLATMNAIILKPDLAESWFQYGIASQVNRKHTTAVEFLTVCLSLNPDHKGAKAHLKKIIDGAAENHSGIEV